MHQGGNKKNKEVKKKEQRINQTYYLSFRNTLSTSPYKTKNIYIGDYAYFLIQIN